MNNDLLVIDQRIDSTEMLKFDKPQDCGRCTGNAFPTNRRQRRGLTLRQLLFDEQPLEMSAELALIEVLALNQDVDYNAANPGVLLVGSVDQDLACR